jgi:rRNA maturation endonuclease Nob1
MVTGVVLMYTGTLEKCDFTIWALMILGFSVLIAGIVVSSKFSRCPACKEYLSQRNITPIKYCPHCGGKINYDESYKSKK